jgi:hypothetical protein
MDLPLDQEFGVDDLFAADEDDIRLSSSCRPGFAFRLHAVLASLFTLSSIVDALRGKILGSPGPSTISDSVQTSESLWNCLHIVLTATPSPFNLRLKIPIVISTFCFSLG